MGSLLYGRAAFVLAKVAGTTDSAESLRHAWGPSTELQQAAPRQELVDFVGLSLA